MTTEVAAHSLFSGPDRGLLENVVLQHDNGVIAYISEGTPRQNKPALPRASRLRQRP